MGKRLWWWIHNNSLAVVHTHSGQYYAVESVLVEYARYGMYDQVNGIYDGLAVPATGSYSKLGINFLFFM